MPPRQKRSKPALDGSDDVGVEVCGQAEVVLGAFEAGVTEIDRQVGQGN